jgi:hypothetical protein
MQSNQDSLQDLSECTVAIENPDNGKVLGTGVIVTDDGLIVTCYHVLENIISNTKTVSIHFPTVVKTKMQADIVQESYNQSLDIAFLKLQTNRPDRMIAANIGEMVSPTHPFSGFGFKKAQEFDGLHVNGEIQGIAHKILRDGTISPPLIQLQSHQIAPGMSGSAILDTKSNKVIGIVSERYRTQDDAYKDLSFGIPVESIIKVYPTLREENPGLKKINVFLHAIGKGNSLLYDKFDEKYVPPNEYDEIEKILKEHRCTFITGEPEYGKTSTAVKLLWEYYNNDYNPKYIEEYSESEIIVTRLDEQDMNLIHSIICFEYPVGNMDYISNTKFQEYISKIINFRHPLQEMDLYLIITMREEVYKEFESALTYKEEIKKYKAASIGNQSYNDEKKKEMLLKWASVKKCKWLQDENLKEMVLKKIVGLPTPLSIKDFIMDTVNIVNENSVLSILPQKSEITPERFAKEVREMTEDKILFFSFLFVSQRYLTGFVEDKYNEVFETLGMEGIPDFMGIYNLFNEKQLVEIRDGCVKFTHFEYAKAIKHIRFSENGSITKEGRVIQEVLFKLAEQVDEYGDFPHVFKEDVAETIVSNYDRMPNDLRDLLDNLLKTRSVGSDVIVPSIIRNSRKNPDLNYVLEEYIDDDRIAPNVARAVYSDFSSMPEDLRNMLLFRLLRKKRNTKDPLLLLLGETNAEIQWYVLGAIASNYDRIPKRIQDEFVRITGDASTVSPQDIVENLTKLPPELGERLVSQFINNKKAVFHLSVALIQNFRSLPPNIKNKLFDLVDVRYTGYDVVRFYARTAPKYKNAQEKLFKFLDDNNIVSKDILYKHQKKLAKLDFIGIDEEITASLDYIFRNFNNLPSDIKTLIPMLIPNEYAFTSNYIIEMAENDKNLYLPPDVNAALLEKAKNRKLILLDQ